MIKNKTLLKIFLFRLDALSIKNINIDPNKGNNGKITYKKSSFEMSDNGVWEIKNKKARLAIPKKIE